MKNTLRFSESNNFSRIRFSFLLLSFLHSCVLIGQGVKFQLVTGTKKHDDARCIIQTLDSGYAVVGSTSAFGNGLSDIYLTKISKTGSVTWQQAFGGTGVDKGSSLIQTADSGYVITGYSNSETTGGYDVYLSKTDKNGTLEWSNNYGGFDWDFGNSVIQTAGGGYVICGSTFSYGKGSADVYLLKTDSNGSLLWDSAYGGSMEEAGNAVAEAADGGYFITGTTKSFGLGEEDVYLLKTNANGNVQWTKTYGNATEDLANDGKATNDGGYIVIGAKKNTGTGFYDYWLLKTDAGGDTLWTRTDAVNFSRIGKSVAQTFDGGYIIGGQGDFYANSDMYLHKVDVLGNYEGINTFGGAKQEYAYSVKQTFDTGYVMVGTTESYGTGIPNIYIVKTDSTVATPGPVVIVVGVTENKMISKKITVYPNPASDYLIVHAESKADLIILDPLGRSIVQYQITKGSNNISMADLPDGIYFIRIINKDGISSGKFIVKH